MTLEELPMGARGRVLSVRGHGALRQRLLDMGFVRGVDFEMVRPAPLGDPIEIKAKGTRLAIRLAEAHWIDVERL